MDFKEKLLKLKARDIMSTDIKTIRGSLTVIRAREIMRLQKTGGLIVTDDKGEVQGIIGMANLVLAQENGMMKQPIERVISKEVVTFSGETSFQEVLDSFLRHRFRRFPVVGEDQKPIGMITPEEIIFVLSNLLEVDKASPGTTQEGDEYSVSFDIQSQDFIRVGEVSTKLKTILKDLGGFPPGFIRRIGVVAYEGETNIVIHSLGGKLEAFIKPEEILLVFWDRGPGIEDIEKARKPGYTTASDQVKEMGFGAGMGLFNMEKYADRLEIRSEAGGQTEIKAFFKVEEQ